MKNEEILNLIDLIEKTDLEIRSNMVHDHEEIMTKWMTSVENDSIWNSGFIAGLDFIKRMLSEKK
jgi:hypothetical protein|tara:strand:+ start:412 stop:606 length:195 start_codon:yes stop_codon:yes gene_type:complete